MGFEGGGLPRKETVFVLNAAGSLQAPSPARNVAAAQAEVQAAELRGSRTGELLCSLPHGLPPSINPTQQNQGVLLYSTWD